MRKRCPYCNKEIEIRLVTKTVEVYEWQPKSGKRVKDVELRKT